MVKEDVKYGSESALRGLEECAIEYSLEQIKSKISEIRCNHTYIDKKYMQEPEEYNYVVEYVEKQDFTKTPSGSKLRSLSNIVKLLEHVIRIVKYSNITCENVKYGLSDYNNEVMLSILWECRETGLDKRVSIGINFESELLTVISDAVGRLDMDIAELQRVECILKSFIIHDIECTSRDLFGDNTTTEFIGAVIRFYKEYNLNSEDYTAVVDLKNILCVLNTVGRFQRELSLGYESMEIGYYYKIGETNPNFEVLCNFTNNSGCSVQFELDFNKCCFSLFINENIEYTLYSHQLIKDTSRAIESTRERLKVLSK